MKMITAIIKPFKLEDVREALAAKKATPSCTAARNTWWIFCPR